MVQPAPQLQAQPKFNSLKCQKLTKLFTIAAIKQKKIEAEPGSTDKVLQLTKDKEAVLEEEKAKDCLLNEQQLNDDLKVTCSCAAKKSSVDTSSEISEQPAAQPKPIRFSMCLKSCSSCYFGCCLFAVLIFLVFIVFFTVSVSYGVHYKLGCWAEMIKDVDNSSSSLTTTYQFSFATALNFG